MGSNNPENNKQAYTILYGVELTVSEAKNGCTREVFIDGKKYTLNIPAGTKAGDMLELKTRNGYLIGTVVISKVTGGDTTVIKPKKAVKTWMFIITGVIIAAIIIGIAFYGNSGTNISYAGIAFKLPSDWEEDDGQQEFNLSVGIEKREWKPADKNRNDIAMWVENYNRNSNKWVFENYYKDGLESIVQRQLDSYEDSEEWELLDEGWITIDGTDCWFYEEVFHNKDGESSFDSDSITVYIPVSNDQMTSLEVWILKGEVDDDTGEYKDNEFYDQNEELRDKIIKSIRITGEGVSENSLPDYDEKKYSYEDISIALPDEFEAVDTGRSLYWEKPEWSDMYIGLYCSNDITDAADYAKERADNDYDYYSALEGYENVNKGSIEIDGVTCYYSEYTRVTDLNRRYNYILNVPRISSGKVISVDISFEDDGIYSDTDRELRDRIINSIKIN
ncbi:MAG: hypothetical protein IKG25_06580 [Mogibacterium sp.]|nr:hypothetical protein [Mogibacterium sp.]MBR4091371.1 hypothetical protein [Mogibacterium sp.]